MGSINELIQIRQAFKIPEAVSIRVVGNPRNNILKSQIGKGETKFEIDQTTEIDKELYKSALGTPVYTDINFLTESYETKTKGQFIDTPNLRYDAVLITASQAKKIIKTEIQGRDFTVKEYIGKDDYGVTINGIITGKNGHYPADEVAFLKQILDAPVPIPVASNYLNNIGINLLVVESYELAQDAGGYSYQTFTINCVSDVPQELRLTNV
jgi:hypothetical protein